MRYFTVFFNAYNNNGKLIFTGNDAFQCIGFFSRKSYCEITKKKLIKNNKIPQVELIVINNIFEFKNEDDYLNFIEE